MEIKKDKKAKLGSITAKNGFKNEKDIVFKFNNWKNDEEAKKWLIIMGYDLKKIEYVKAVVLTGYKADVNVQIQIKLKTAIDVENIQVKLVSNKKGYNQIDKRWLKNYRKLWDIPSNVYNIFAYFTGEFEPYKIQTKDKRRMFMYEFTTEEKNILLEWLNQNKLLVISDVLKGRGEYSAEWVLVIQKSEEKIKWALKNINEVINHYYNDGKVQITKKGSLKIGKVTIQRKGGDRGRKTANMLQFKIDPSELLD